MANLIITFAVIISVVFQIIILVIVRIPDVFASTIPTAVTNFLYPTFAMV